MADMSELHIGWITGNYPFIIPVDNIVNVKQRSYHGKGEHDGAMLVKVEFDKPYIDFVCATEEEWNTLFQLLRRCKKVVNINDYKKEV